MYCQRNLSCLNFKYVLAQGIFREKPHGKLRHTKGTIYLITYNKKMKKLQNQIMLIEKNFRGKSKSKNKVDFQNKRSK